VKRITPQLTVAIFLLVAYCSAEAGKVGEQLPELRLNFFGRDPDYANKPVLLEFWATWCPPCRESIPHLNELHAKYKERGLVIIGATDEAASVIRKFQKDTPMDYAVATDSGGKLNEQMGVDGIPHAFLADSSGKIVWEGHPMKLREEEIEKVLGASEAQPEEPDSRIEEDGDAAVIAESSSPESPAETPASGAGTAEAPVLAAEDTAGMESKVGAEIVVEGIVQNVGKGPNDGITFLNFGDRRTGFVAVIFRPAYEKFPEGFDKYAQQKVRVRGTLEKFQDRQMQVKIFTPDQLEIVAAAP
jgi:thiol-disulfide isomerase/thioredoxin